MDPISYLFAALAALAAGMINALAGGGTLITFPVLVGIGLPTVIANTTNTLGLWTGSLGGTLAQARDIKDQMKRVWIVIPAAIMGGLTGGILLLQTPEKLFANLVPFLILAAACLLAIQTPLRNWLTKRKEHTSGRSLAEAWIFLPVFLVAIYGGYFGAGMGIILLAVMGLMLNDTLTRINVLKQIIAFTANFTAALLFVFSGKVVWSVAVVMMLAALLGGSLGGRLAGRVKPAALRWIVVSIGIVVGIIYLVRQFIL